MSKRNEARNERQREWNRKMQCKFQELHNRLPNPTTGTQKSILHGAIEYIKTLENQLEQPCPTTSEQLLSSASASVPYGATNTNPEKISTKMEDIQKENVPSVSNKQQLQNKRSLSTTSDSTN